MERWASCIQVKQGKVLLLVKDPHQGDVLRASLPLQSNHPRAILTLLEGMALYQGGRLTTVLCADEGYPPWLGSGLFGDELWPAESPLVRFEVVARGHRKRLKGLGDFSSLHRVLGDSK